MAWRPTPAAGGSAGSNEDFWVDKEGIPHWNGRQSERHLKQYKTRVLVEYESLIGESDHVKEKRASLGLRLTRGLTDKAWDIVEPLLDDMAALKVDGGHRLVTAALDRLTKEVVLQKQEKFEDFFKKSWRRYGQDVAEYIREKEQKYNELTRMDKETKLSDDLYAYFLLEGARLSPGQRKLVTMVADNAFETQSFVKALRTNFHDQHLQEQESRRREVRPQACFAKGGGKSRGKGKFKGKGKRKEQAHFTEEEHDDEDEDGAGDEAYWNDGGEDPYDDDAYEIEDVPSDAGASQDEDISEAYTAYEQARAQLRDQQKKRGFFKATGTLTFEERKAEIKKEKQQHTKLSCGDCGQRGHWAGDPECPKGARPAGKGGSKGKQRARDAKRPPVVRGMSQKRSPSGEAGHYVSYFVLDDAEFGAEDDDEVAFCAEQEVEKLPDEEKNEEEILQKIPDQANEEHQGQAEAGASAASVKKDNENKVLCPKCSAEQTVRRNRTNGGLFWGCGRWPACDGTRRYADGNLLRAGKVPACP